MDKVEIRKIVCNHFKISIVDFVGTSRKRELVIAREQFCKLVYSPIVFPLREVGDLIGGRNYATVLNSLNQFKNDYDTNVKFREDYQELLKLINE